MNKCKNCGHDKDKHEWGTESCLDDINPKGKRHVFCKCKQFTPSEEVEKKIINVLGIKRGRQLGTNNIKTLSLIKEKSYGKYCVNCLPDGNPSDECKIYGHQYEMYKSPSCSNHSPLTVPDTKDKELDNLSEERESSKESGSPFILSEKTHSGHTSDYGYIKVKDVKEFIRLLKEDFKLHGFKVKEFFDVIDKRVGDLK